VRQAQAHDGAMNTHPEQPTRNPFGVQDAPDPDGPDVDEFADSVELDGGNDDPNAQPWGSITDEVPDSIAGAWSSRWNGGADPSLSGDSAEAWKEGKAMVEVAGGRFYLLFDWGSGERHALLDVRYIAPDTLVGRYINLSSPDITRPWVGRIVDNRRIDGRWTNGRLDFRR
jgi:hypothetical protein